MQVVHLAHAGHRGHRAADRAGSVPAGAASRNTRPAARTSRSPLRAISAATTSEATASARVQPVSRMTSAGDRGGQERPQVGDQVRQRAPDVQAGRSARPASSTASRLTATPISATTSTAPPGTCGGWISRRTAATVNQAASSSRVMPFAWADSASTRVKP